MTDLDKEALFLRLFSEHKDRIYRLCYGYVTNQEDVVDLFQEVMIRIWDNLESFRQEAALKTWIYRITVNTALLFRKKLTRDLSLFRAIDPDILTSNQFRNQEVATDKSKVLEKLNQFLTTQKKQDRLLLVLYLEGLSYQEIADITGISSNYVGVKISRLKTVITERLGAYHD